MDGAILNNGPPVVLALIDRGQCLAEYYVRRFFRMRNIVVDLPKL
jgi:hypothetical protein